MILGLIQFSLSFVAFLGIPPEGRQLEDYPFRPLLFASPLAADSAQENLKNAAYHRDSRHQKNYSKTFSKPKYFSKKFMDKKFQKNILSRKFFENFFGPPPPKARMFGHLQKNFSATIIAKGGRGENRRHAAYGTQGSALSVRARIFSGGRKLLRREWAARGEGNDERA